MVPGRTVWIFFLARGMFWPLFWPAAEVRWLVGGCAVAFFCSVPISVLCVSYLFTSMCLGALGDALVLPVFTTTTTTSTGTVRLYNVCLAHIITYIYILIIIRLGYTRHRILAGHTFTKPHDRYHRPRSRNASAALLVADRQSPARCSSSWKATITPVRELAQATPADPRLKYISRVFPQT